MNPVAVEVLKFIGGILASGTLAAIIVAIANKAKVKAEADSTFADIYLKVDNQLSAKAQVLVNQYEKRIQDLIASCESKLQEKDALIKQQQQTLVEQRDIIEEQRAVINEQKETIKVLTHQLAEAVEESRTEMHKTVDVVADKLNPEINT